MVIAKRSFFLWLILFAISFHVDGKKLLHWRDDNLFGVEKSCASLTIAALRKMLGTCFSSIGSSMSFAVPVT